MVNDMVCVSFVLVKSGRETKSKSESKHKKNI